MEEDAKALNRADISLDLNDLCQQCDVTQRTVRYYIQQGLLPSPGLGAGARYGSGHLTRLKLIRKMQREHLPLAEIRRRLEGMDDEAVHGLLGSPEPTGTASTSSAVGYVQAVLRSPDHVPPPMPRRTSPLSSGAPSGPAGSMAPQPGSSPNSRPVTDRTQWDRITLTPDIELHVRRPLSREDNRRLERLLEAARRIFEEAP